MKLSAQIFTIFLNFLILVILTNLFFTPHIFAQSQNCSLNIYPTPAPGTKDYLVTFTDNTTTPFSLFSNNWYGITSNGEIDTIGNGGTGTINSYSLPLGWTYIGTQSYDVLVSGITSIKQITYQINLSLNYGFGGIDIGGDTENQYKGTWNICQGHYTPSDITYNPIVQFYLNVPLIKQTSNPWQSQIYDNANKWNPSAPTINSWGCALTSAAMVFKYYGMNKLPDGSPLDPGTLNSWLKNQKDGYIGQGLVNWLALSRLSKLSKEVNETNFDALEYKRKNGDVNQLATDITSGVPDILKERGHYIVAKGINGNTFDINDPYYNINTLNDYNNNFQSIGSFTKSNTDLSYIMLTVNPNINLTVTNSNNEAVGENFIEDPIVNPENPNQTNSPLKIFYLSTPPDGIYNISLSSNTATNYSLGIYLYDINGNVKINNLSGTVKPNKDTKFDINFKGKILTDLNNFLSNGSIDNPGIYDSLVAKITPTNNFLKDFLNELNAQKGKHISQDAYNVLLTDLGL